MIKAVSFDLDEVYFKNGKSNFIFNLMNLGVAEAEVKRVFLESDQMNNKYKTGNMSDVAFWTWAIHEWKLRDKSVDDLLELLISGYEINKEAVEFIRNARKVGYKALVCTNNFPARIYGLDKKFKFLRDFDVVVMSYEVGVTKPDKKVFEVLIEKSGVAPNEIIMTDDNVRNLDGAKALGINVILYKSFPEFILDLERWGVSV